MGPRVPFSAPRSRDAYPPSVPSGLGLAAVVPPAGTRGGGGNRWWCLEAAPSGPRVSSVS